MRRQSDFVPQVDWHVLECVPLASATRRVTKYTHDYEKGTRCVAIDRWIFVAANPMRAITEHL
jgi:hypothetical protein